MKNNDIPKGKGQGPQTIPIEFIQSDLIALFEFETTADGVRVRTERHYHLVPSEELTEEELRLYRIPALSQLLT